MAAAATEQREKENTFEAVAMDWFNSYSPDLSEKHALRLRRNLENDLLPALGNRSVARLTTLDKARVMLVVRNENKASLYSGYEQ